jgi:hypothetical protein
MDRQASATGSNSLSSSCRYPDLGGLWMPILPCAWAFPGFPESVFHWLRRCLTGNARRSSGEAFLSGF